MTAARPTSPAVAGSRARPPGFTMVELIVVAVLMVILASVVVPRVMGNGARRGRATAEGVRDLLSAAGERAAMTSQAIALAFDAGAPGGGRIALLSAPAPGGALVPDPLVRPAALDGLEVERCIAGGVALNPGRWRIPLTASDPRPSVALVVGRADAGRWLVSLPSGAVSATLSEVNPGEEPPSGAPGQIDLDRAGRRDQPW